MEGSWDRAANEDWTSLHEQALAAEVFEETVFFRGLRERFVLGRAWNDTELYDFLGDRLAATDHTWHGYQTVERLPEYFRDVDSLYRSIERSGYRTQAELSRTGSAEGFGFIDQLINEVTVDIGRDGELLFVDGKHRLAIAKLLGIERIPVVVLVRHSDWMQRREAVYQDGVQLEHPDVDEIVNG